ncbi:MAG: hypothetical protein LBE27_08805 [Deltaproteobacteria bacterium]|nr:hypothetical protein [Deltaproteobacteria bacterium]
MKLHRFLISVLSFALLTVFVAGELMAESPVTFSGYLRIRGFATGGYFAPLGTDTTAKAGDRFAISRFRVNLVFKPNDNVEIRWRFQAPSGSRWGTSEHPATTSYMFGILKTDFGNFSIGRISTDIDSAGLQTLGYTPGWGVGTQGYIFDHDTERDGFIYRNNWDNGMGLKIFYAKMNSANPSATDPMRKDFDYDRYSVEPYYKWENGGVSLALQYDRNNYHTSISTSSTQTNPARNNYFSVNPAFMQKWAFSENVALTMHAEAKYSNGKYKPSALPNAPTFKQDGFGAYLDFDLNYGSGNTTLGGWYFDGNGEKQTTAGSTNFVSDPDRHNLVQPGQAFYPFVVFYRGFTAPATRLATWGGAEQPNHWAYALMGNHKINDYVTLNYGIADFRRSRGAQLVNGTKVSKHLGTEFDLGIVVKFLDTVQFSSKVGVFANGPYYKERYLDNNYDGTTWAWGNELIFNF